jgi:competence protein ComEC
MPTEVHFINVGQGNMTLLKLANGKVYLYDCNVTNANEVDVLAYLRRQIGIGTGIDVFICSHRDADHIRGIKKIHAKFPVQHVWDSGAVGTTPYCTEYLEYMQLRRSVRFTEVKHKTFYDCGNTRLWIMNAKNDDLADNANAQSIVVKVVHRDNDSNTNHGSVLLTGDTDAVTWQNINKHYSKSDLSCSILLASHHGSITYFDDPTDEKNYYIDHLKAKSPAMTVVSVGNNAHGHPDVKALSLYEKYSRGSDRGNKVYRTDEKGNIKLILKDGGGWTLSVGN